MRKTALIVSVLVAALLVPVGATTTGFARDARPSVGHGRHAASTTLTPAEKRRLARKIAAARAATARYATDLDAAKSDGYDMQITQMIPDMGYHFLNPDVDGFDVTRPPILVYERDGDDWQLAALEWVFTEKPAEKPLPGARYGSFPAACHYEDGTFDFQPAESECSETSPSSGAPFTFWHPDLVTLHVWVWYPNPDGLFSGTNRWARPFNDESL